jgi:hypothetical protein
MLTRLKAQFGTDEAGVVGLAEVPYVSGTPPCASTEVDPANAEAKLKILGYVKSWMQLAIRDFNL